MSEPSNCGRINIMTEMKSFEAHQLLKKFSSFGNFWNGQRNAITEIYAVH